MASGRPLSENLPAIAGGLVSVIFGSLFAFWLTRIIDQSDERRRLIEQLEATRSELAATEALTSREVEVLELVARGASNADIAAALFVSEATVKPHLLHTFAKLEVDDRTAAVVAALERGIITLPRRPR